MHERESFALYFFNHYRQNGLLLWLVFRKKDETCAVFALLRHRNALQQYEFVRNLEHDSRAVSSLVVGTFGSSVAHILKYAQSVVY